MLQILGDLLKKRRRQNRPWRRSPTLLGPLRKDATPSLDPGRSLICEAFEQGYRLTLPGAFHEALVPRHFTLATLVTRNGHQPSNVCQSGTLPSFGKRITAPSIGAVKRQRECRDYNTYPDVANRIFSKVHEVRRKAETGDFEVPKLFLVERIATEVGIPHYEKRVLEILNVLVSKKERKKHNLPRRPIGSVTIVKNTPLMCKMLWRVKHLVRVCPITFPDGEPKEGDYLGTHLDRNGVFRITPKLRVEEERLLLSPDYQKRQLRTRDIRKVLHNNWNNNL